MSRILYTTRHGAIATKPEAASWAQEALLNRWIPLIQRALAWSEKEPPRLEETRACLRYACGASSGPRSWVGKEVA